jgi:hypothetical protein
MANSIKTLLVIFTFFSFIPIAYGDRVIEVEQRIKNDISFFLDKFSPGTKFSVHVEVKPLRRVKEGGETSNLPFMDVEEEAFLDEWDDPSLNVFTLYGRIKEARVSLKLESGVTINDKDAFERQLFNEVSLVSGRDVLSISTMTAPLVKEDFSWLKYRDEFFLTLFFFALAVLSYSVIAGFKRLSGARSQEPSSQTPVAAPISPVRATSATPLSAGGTMMKGDLFLQDPTKISEVVKGKISTLIEGGHFPTLRALQVLEELNQSDSKAFSFIVFEFPKEFQKRIYQYGKGENWFKGYTDFGHASSEAILTLDKLIRESKTHFSYEFELMLMCLWRCGEEMKEVLKTMESEKAFFVLSFFPKNMAIPLAKSMFPGKWGYVLDIEKKECLLSESEIRELTDAALRKRPLFDFNTLNEFKDRKDLLTYLDHAEPHEEREVYTIVGADSDLSSIRPPFFKVFDLSENELRTVFEVYSIEEWAIALFNVNHAERVKFVKVLDEKERYLFSQRLKVLGQSELDLNERLRMRKNIAQTISELLSNNDMIIGEEGTDDEIEADVA